MAGRLPNAVFRATLSGFADPDQEALTAPFRDPYFSVLSDIWVNWSSDMAKRFVLIGYSVCPTDAETIRITDAYIAKNRRPRRCGGCWWKGGDVARALRCRERDALAG